MNSACCQCRSSAVNKPLQMAYTQSLHFCLKSDIVLLNILQCCRFIMNKPVNKAWKFPDNCLLKGKNFRIALFGKRPIHSLNFFSQRHYIFYNDIPDVFQI